MTLKQLQSNLEKEKSDRLTQAWKKLHQKPNSFLHGRDGDHLMVPFECDLCIFRKLKGHNPGLKNETDSLLLACIRRANLDAFWSSASSTVEGNMRKTKLALNFSSRLGLKGPYSQDGPLPNYDHCGYEVAIQMLMNSLNKGRNNPNYTQFDTIRKIRTAYSNQVRASNQASCLSVTINDQSGKYQRISTDICGSLWFKKILKGCHNRMGEEWMPNKALGIPLLKTLIREIERDILEAEDPEDKHFLTVFSCYICVTYVISLRGTEGLLLDLDGMNRNWTEPSKGHFIIALLGKVKGEHHEQAHLIPCVDKTSSGIPVRNVVLRLLKLKRKVGWIDGPAITNSKGVLYSLKDLDYKLVEVLTRIYLDQQNLFPIEIKDLIRRAKDDHHKIIKKYYSCFRTFRRTSDSRALDMNDILKQDDIDIVNRWKSLEKARGKRPGRQMKQHYAEVSVLLKPYLRYTSAM